MLEAREEGGRNEDYSKGIKPEQDRGIFTFKPRQEPVHQPPFLCPFDFILSSLLLPPSTSSEILESKGYWKRII